MAKLYDRHHIVPKCRCRDLGINPNFPGNVIRVKTSKHRAYHILFGSKTIEEAIEMLKREWDLSEAGEAEFKRLTKNVVLLRRKR